MHAVSAKLERQVGGQGYHFFAVPPDMAESLRSAGHKRVLLSLNGVVYRRALISMQDVGGYVVMLGLDIMRAHHLENGSIIRATLSQDPNPDDLGLPEELTEWLAYDDEARAAWDKLTPGTQRSLGYYVSTGKRAETRIKRSEEIATKIKRGMLSVQQNKK
jgi:hypothetical protein